MCGSHKLTPGNHRLASSSPWTWNPSREATSSGFGSLEVSNWQCPHFIHSTFVDLEGGCHPAAAGTLLTPPAEGAQLRCAFGTQKLSFHYSEQRWLHPLHGLGEVRGALLTSIATKLSRVCYPLVGKGCWSASFHVGQNAGATEQSAPAFPAPVENLCVWSLAHTGWINSKDFSG